MKIRVLSSIMLSVILSGCIRNSCCGNKAAGAESLSLWNEGQAKSSVVQFVESVTDKSSPNYLEPSERIATFDMDGTILVEKPLYVVFDFAIRQVTKKMTANSTLKEKQPYKAVANRIGYIFMIINIRKTDSSELFFTPPTDIQTNNIQMR